MTPAIELRGAGRQFSGHWALRDCSISLPRKGVVALTGPNGAGKSTLLELVAGLRKPSSGSVRVLGLDPFEDADRAIGHIAFVAQGHPLYQSLSVEELFAFGKRAVASWDDSASRQRLRALAIPFGKPIRTMSEGQKAQVALGFALAKQADVVLLDEPLASLDPLARREFLQSLLGSVAESSATVVLSSHIVSDLERSCDYLILLAGGRIRLAVDIEEAKASHVRLSGPTDQIARLVRDGDVLSSVRSHHQLSAVVRMRDRVVDPALRVDPLALEDIVLAYLSEWQKERTSVAV